MLYLILSYVVVILCIYHCHTTGRDQRWIFALIVFGGLASIAYIVLEFLPDLKGSVTGKRAARKIGKVVNPKGDFKKLSKELERSASGESRHRLAEELLEREEYAEAEQLYRESRTGMFEHDPVFMLGQAKSLFALKRYSEVVQLMDELIEKNPDYRSQTGHLLYSRALGETGDHAKARSEFETLISYFTGPEAEVHFAQYLEDQGDRDRAKELYTHVLDTADLSPSHYRREYKQWIKIAKGKV